ncbi:MAG: alcohol dehydrogenase catalytic domain-containing protein [Nocardioidaceae bacterium]
MRARAAVLHAAGDVRIEERDLAPLGPGEVLVKVMGCGICGSDAAEWSHGPVLAAPPVVLGHEFTGVVEAVGDGVSGLSVGARVVSGAGVSCGSCSRCVEGRTNLCLSYHTVGFHRDGGLAGHAVVPASTLLDVSGSGLAFDTLAMAQPMAIAVHAVRRSGLRADQVAVVIGVGGIGGYLTVAASALGAHVVVTDLDPARLDLAKRLGAAATFRSGEVSLVDFLAEHELRPDVIFEASGSRPGIESAFAAVPRGGTIVPVGIQREPFPATFATWTFDEYAVIGSVAHVIADDLPEAVRLLQRDVDWSLMAPQVVSLDQLVEEGLIPLAEGRSRYNKLIVDPWAMTPRPADHTRLA